MCSLFSPWVSCLDSNTRLTPIMLSLLQASLTKNEAFCGPSGSGHLGGAGHSVPLVIIGAVVLLANEAALGRYETVAPYFEFGVGIMLIYLGFSAAWNVTRGDLHIHNHRHGKKPHVHIHSSHEPAARHSASEETHNNFFILGQIPVFRVKSFAIGIVHGLAGSAAVTVALLPSIDAAWTGVSYIILFSIGTMLSMAALTRCFLRCHSEPHPLSGLSTDQ